MKKKLLMFVLAAMLVTSCVACTKTPSDKSDSKASTATTEVVSKDDKVQAQDIKAEDLTPLADKGVISGVKDLTVAEGTQVDLNELIYMDKTIVKGVDVDDSKVDYTKAGTYEVIYTITFDGDKLRDFLKSNDLTVSFDTTGNTVIVKTTVTVTVATKEDADAAIANGDTSVVTEESKSEVQKENKEKANDNAVESTPTPTPAQSNSSKNNSSGSNGNSGNHNGNSGNNGNTDNNGNHNGNTNGNGNNNGSGNNGSTEKPHTHSWDGGTVTVQATCTAAGTKVYHCSCGETKTESIPALGHDMVHHDATTHPEQRLVKDAWTETIYGKRYVCTDCGAQFENNRDAGKHIAASDSCHNYSLEKVATGTLYHEAQYETVQVSDNNAYNACSRCGYKQ